MRTKSYNPTGFTFVESLITFSIVGIFLALTWSTVSFLLLKSNDQIVRTRAHFLTMEGIEILKQIRQTAVNQNRETGFQEIVGKKEGSYTIIREGDGFGLKSKGHEIIEMQEDPFTDYCRTIQITGDSPLIKKITSTVTWGSLECSPSENTIRYSTYLADLKK